MPFKYVGKITNYYAGKTLSDIIYNVKNFAKGRIVYRYSFQSRYPQPSYYIITDVFPRPEAELSKSDSCPLAFKGRKVFRGDDVGEMRIKAGHKADWRLVPRDQEESFLTTPYPPRERPSLPEAVNFPPLLERMIVQEGHLAGKDMSQTPMLKLFYLKKPLSSGKNANIVADSKSSDASI